ncbi:MAG TPA: hypothetical protein VE988_03940 [Gemmataceae bacterium]|nr:hypothetical protein [Gemmataceae bacterium]
MTPEIPPPQPDELSGIRRATQKLRLPMVSGRGSMGVLLLCFCTAAAMTWTIGLMMHLPIWVEFEIMLAAWWIVWIFALAHFLFHGKRVSDDYQMPQPRNWFRRSPTPPGSSRTKSPSSSPYLWDLGGMGGAEEGCLWVLAIVAAIIVLFLAAWLLIEIVIPVLTVILYALIRGMLARVANDRHGCTGRFAPAFFWGTVWATVYTGPLVLMVWVVHLIVAYNAAVAR